MQKISKLVFVISLAIISGLVSLVNVSAQSATPQQLQQISNNCISLKSTINQLHASDALLRVNMGQLYELVSTKLMDRFNSRVSSNNLKTDKLATSSGIYKIDLDAFRADYIIYEESIVSLIKTDCRSNPGGFYDLLIVARSNRSRVYDDVKRLNQQIDQYRSEVSQFEKDFQSAGGK